MSEEITTEVIAKAIDKTRDIARSGAEEVWLDIGDKEVKFVVLDSIGAMIAMP
ncbi:hypothetical protein G7067_12545 [Leucobacter insecticola]|uniref:Uncharacterized protein n=1 Tax=Leucobacter insecticola TaxID=2714934 RepID=A0A6G8FKS7_9MICO|nr:hypothetical protein [Leucobacter insecticola]QIM17046.1 hypothetical protein G7067_12545 [Leucobacter insecticola]